MANTYGVVGQDNPGAVLTALYTVPASTQLAIGLAARSGITTLGAEGARHVKEI